MKKGKLFPLLLVGLGWFLMSKKTGATGNGETFMAGQIWFFAQPETVGLPETMTSQWEVLTVDAANVRLISQPGGEINLFHAALLKRTISATKARRCERPNNELS